MKNGYGILLVGHIFVLIGLMIRYWSISNRDYSAIILIEFGIYVALASILAAINGKREEK